MSKPIKFFLILLFLILYSGNRPVPSKGRAVIDVVFCLDLSGSTNGLLDDVREKLWDIVNQVNSYRPAPEFRIGVIGFSRPSFGAKNSYVKVLQQLTTDFDKLNFELYKLKPSVEKGDQIVSEAIKTAIRQMNWSGDPDALKVIYLVGNGMVNAGGDNYREACEQATRKSIIVNTVYCRTRNNVDKELPGWREIARLTGGEQYDIRIHKRTPLILTSPNTIEFRDLAGKLSETYLYYGEDGDDRYKMMAALDKNARLANEMTFESRLYYKISDRYQFHQQYWDLVDYLKMTNSDFADVNLEYLNDSLKFKTKEQVREIVSQTKDKRSRLIMELRKHLPYDRQAYLNKKMEDRDIDKSDMFDRVVINSLNALATSKGFSTSGTSSIEFRR
ncbi:MAG: VWA domain-containing protein [Bacteroidota bacterium]|nr:VWA domain-containing protein [Bacteroidota bacterium]